MNIIREGRQSGRTSQLLADALHYAMDKNKRAIFVTHSEGEANRVRRLLERNAVNYPNVNVISIDNIGTLKGMTANVFIDNLDYCLRIIFGNEVDTVVLEK